jgi:hypothetical protein
MEEKILPKTFSKKTEFTTGISTADSINRFKNKKDLRKSVQKNEFGPPMTCHWAK